MIFYDFKYFITLTSIMNKKNNQATEKLFI